ncbi:hypothetical protein ACJX0J_014616 [Zea mays]
MIAIVFKMQVESWFFKHANILMVLVVGNVSKTLSLHLIDIKGLDAAVFFLYSDTRLYVWKIVETTLFIHNLDMELSVKNDNAGAWNLIIVSFPYKHAIPVIENLEIQQQHLPLQPNYYVLIFYRIIYMMEGVQQQHLPFQSNYYVLKFYRIIYVVFKMTDMRYSRYILSVSPNVFKMTDMYPCKHAIPVIERNIIKLMQQDPRDIVDISFQQHLPLVQSNYFVLIFYRIICVILEIQQHLPLVHAIRRYTRYILSILSPTQHLPLQSNYFVITFYRIIYVILEIQQIYFFNIISNLVMSLRKKKFYLVIYYFPICFQPMNGAFMLIPMPQL